MMVFKVGEVRADRLTMDDIVEIETRHPIMIGNVVPLGRVEEPRARKRGKRHGVARHARRRAARRR